jgi:guanylate kinase
MPRPKEVNNRDYSFISRDEFRAMADGDEFIEWAEVHGQFYGTSRRRLEELTGSGDDVILDIDTKGAMQVRKKYKGGVYIFVLPPSMEILRKRLETRMTDSKEEMARRLKTAVSEIRTYVKYDYVIINDILEKALGEFEAVIISHRVSAKRIEPLWVKERFLKEEEH